MTPLLLLAAAASAFNLECSGESYVTKGLLGPKESVHPFSIEYRIDLASQRYCSGDCSTTKALFRVSETQIVFEAEERDTLDDTLVLVSREDGQYMNRLRWFASQDVHIVMSSGQCRRAPFTGFPALRF